MDLIPVVTTFGIVAVAELGDKTQLAAITLSANYRAAPVFTGAMLAVLLIDGLSILAGSALVELIPLQFLRFFGAAIFIGFGVKTFLKDNEEIDTKGGKSAILASFSMVAVTELGDKTQFSVIALAAEYNAPVFVFLGMMLAYVLLMGTGVALGRKLIKFVPKRYLKIMSGVLFIIFGLMFLLGATGIVF